MKFYFPLNLPEEHMNFKISNIPGNSVYINYKALLIVMKDKLATIIRAVNYIKTTALNTKLFTKLCKNMDYNQWTPLFYTYVGGYQKLTC